MFVVYWPWVVSKTLGMVFPNIDWPRLMNNQQISYSSVKVWKTVQQVLDTTRGYTPRVELMKEGSVFLSKNQPTLLNNIFIFPETQLNSLWEHQFIITQWNIALIGCEKFANVLVPSTKLKLKCSTESLLNFSFTFISKQCWTAYIQINIKFHYQSKMLD